MDNHVQAELRQLEDKRDQFVDRLAWFALGLIGVFGVPAALAVYIGRNVIGTTTALIISLVIAFVFSWVVVLFYYQQNARQVRKLERRIKELRSEIGEEQKEGE